MIPLKPNIRQINPLQSPWIHTRLIRPIQHGCILTKPTTESNRALVSSQSSKLALIVFRLFELVLAASDDEALPDVAADNAVYGVDVLDVGGVVEGEG